MVRLNKREQMARYSSLRQGDREYIVSFKTRFDAQILASRGAGVADIDEETMAMDFIFKLDTKRYEKMYTCAGTLFVTVPTLIRLPWRLHSG